VPYHLFPPVSSYSRLTHSKPNHITMLKTFALCSGCCACQFLQHSSRAMCSMPPVLSCTTTYCYLALPIAHN